MKRVAAAVICVSALAAGVNAGYAPGFVWDRSVDWANDNSAGGHAAIPTLDSQGHGVWYYYVVGNTKLGCEGKTAAQAYFKTAESPIAWPPGAGNPVSVETVLGSGVYETWTQDAYARGGAAPWYSTNWVASSTWNGADAYRNGTFNHSLIYADRMSDNQGTFAGAYVRQPLVVWRNPTGKAFALRIRGTLVLKWTNVGGEAIDYVIMHSANGGSTWTEALGGSAARPAAGSNVSVSIPVDVTVLVKAGDWVLASLRQTRPVNYCTFGTTEWGVAPTGGSNDSLLYDDLTFTWQPSGSAFVVH